MNKRLLLSAVILITGLTVSAQTPAYLSSFRIAGFNYDTGDFIETDASGNTYVAGTFGTGCDFDPSGGQSTLTPTGNTDIFIAKYSPAGALLWKYPLNGNSEFLYNMNIDQQGNIWLMGAFYGGLNVFGLGSSLNATTVAGGDAFLAKYDSLGHAVSLSTIGSSGTENFRAIAFDSNGDYYVGGDFSSGSIDLDPSSNLFLIHNTTVNGINSNAFIAKYNAAGNLLWGLSLSNSTTGTIRAMEIDSSGRLVVAGHFTNTITVDSAGTSLTSNSQTTDCFVLRYSSQGIFDNAWSYGGSDLDNTISMATSGDDIVVTGVFSSNIDIDPGSTTNLIQSAGLSDIFLIKFNANGTLQWGGTIRGASAEVSSKVRTGTNGDVYVSGYFTTEATFDLTAPNGISNAYMGRDGFMAKYSSAGSLITRMVIGGNGFDGCSGIALAPNNEFVVTGSFMDEPIYVDPIQPSNMINDLGQSDIYVARYKDSLVSTGIASVSLNEIIVYPVPAGDYINIDLKKNGNYSAQILDASGRIASKSEYNFNLSARIDTRSLESGIYFIAVKNENGEPAYYRFIKQ